jgi:hypothetical protein
MGIQVIFTGEPSDQESTIRAALEARFNPNRFRWVIEARVHYSGDRFEATATTIPATTGDAAGHPPSPAQDMTDEVRAVIQSVGGKLRAASHGSR